MHAHTFERRRERERAGKKERDAAKWNRIICRKRWYKRRLWVNWKHPLDSANYRNIMRPLSLSPSLLSLSIFLFRDLAVAPTRHPRAIPYVLQFPLSLSVSPSLLPFSRFLFLLPRTLHLLMFILLSCCLAAQRLRPSASNKTSSPFCFHLSLSLSFCLLSQGCTAFLPLAHGATGISLATRNSSCFPGFPAF